MAASSLLQVRLTPRAGRDAVGPWRDDGVLLVRVSAPPADGQANRALLRLLARSLGVSSGALALVRGAAARDKTIRIDGLDGATVRARLAAVRDPAAG